MAMESLEVVHNKFESSSDVIMQTGDDVKESETLGADLVADLDSYWQDINDRLIISRMVSDSVIKGMVTAITQEAADKIGQKELEVVRLKEMLHAHCVGVDDKETLASLERQQESHGTAGRTRCSFLEAVTEQARMKDNLRGLRSVSKEQFMRLKKEINRIRGCNSMKRISSGSELLGLGGILREETSKRWSDADKTLDSLKMMIETVFKGADEIVQLSEASLHEWKQEQEFQAEIEALVMGNCIRSLEQEFEEKLWDQICGDKNINWSGRMKDISSLREELNSLSKSLCAPEAGQLISHGSLDGEGWTNGKKSHFQHKSLGNHVALSPSLCEENGKHEEPQNDKLENPDPNCLNHMTRDELVAFYNNELTRLKRNHESKVQEMTEEYFCLKREYLRVKGSSLLLKKDKEFNMLRRKIPEVILKLDDILLENEKVPASKDAESLSSLKERLEALLAENRQLRDFLTDKKKEVKCLATQVSDATKRMSQLSLSEARLLNTIRYFESSIEDLHIEASIGADVFNCLLREMMGQIKRTLEDSCVEFKQHYESIIKEASDAAQLTSKCGVEDSDMLSIIMQGVFEVIFRESWQEAKGKLDMLTRKYIGENEVRVSLEKEVLEKGKTLEIELADKERLKQEILFLAKEKERLAHDAAAALQSEKEQFQLAAKELDNLRIQLLILILENSIESEAVKGDLAAALEEIKLSKLQICKLNENFDLAVKDFRAADDERRMLLDVIQEKQNALSVHEASEKEVGKQMESMVILVEGLSKATTDFECTVSNHISNNCLRLKHLSSQSRLLIKKANILRRTGVLYKQRIDRRCSDLQKAETEVDLLGDEVDNLLSILEKIYIALDHYSPILRHYPGIMEILKLVKRELSGESTRSIRSTHSPAQSGRSFLPSG